MIFNLEMNPRPTVLTNNPHYLVALNLRAAMEKQPIFAGKTLEEATTVLNSVRGVLNGGSDVGVVVKANEADRYNAYLLPPTHALFSTLKALQATYDYELGKFQSEPVDVCEKDGARILCDYPMLWQPPKSQACYEVWVVGEDGTATVA